MSKKSDSKLRMNIQMFAEEAANVTDTQEETVNTENANGNENENEKFNFTDGSPVSNTTDTDKSEPSKKDNTKAFSDRLKKEKLKLEKEFADKKQAEMDQIAVARGFKDWNELEAYSQKDRLEAMGIQNPEDFNSYINELVAKSPVLEEAKKILESQKQHEEERMVTDAIAEIHKLDPEVNTLDDLIKLENYDEFYGMVEKGYSIPDAYKIAAFDKITARKVDGAAQNVRTNINSKSHMKPLSGSKSTDVVVPADVIASYHKNMPDMTEQEIKEHYNRFIGGK